MLQKREERLTTDIAQKQGICIVMRLFIHGLLLLIPPQTATGGLEPIIFYFKPIQNLEHIRETWSDTISLTLTLKSHPPDPRQWVSGFQWPANQPETSSSPTHPFGGMIYQTCGLTSRRDLYWLVDQRSKHNHCSIRVQVWLLQELVLNNNQNVY